jgi:hypothetical protein
MAELEQNWAAPLVSIDLRKMPPSTFQASAPLADASSSSRVAATSSPFREHLSQVFSDLSGPEVPWNRTTVVALAVLGALWGLLMYSTWAAWGELTADCGREMYVPAVLAEGKVLYRDVWYLYGPVAPYLNSLLFRLFGVNLNVLYWAGSLSALGSAFFLYLTGMRLSSWVVGWTAGAVVLLQAFQPGLFCFPLPYSFSSVYGCLTACIFLWLVIGACTSSSWVWTFGAGTAAAVALLLKIEFGVACYAALFLLLAARGFRERSWKRVVWDLLAILPGALLCVAVIAWMVSIAGVAFITQENVMSWPTSFYMRTYGKYWMEYRGFSLSASALVGAMLRTAILGVVVIGLYWLLRRARSDKSAIFLGAELGVAGLAYLVTFLPWRAQMVFRWIFFPQDMVIYAAVAAAAAWWYFLRRPRTDRILQLALLLTFSSLLAFRILLLMNPAGYPIYYDAPVVLAYLCVMARLIIPRRDPSRQFVLQAEVLVCFACLTAVAFHSIPLYGRAMDYVPLTSERGTIRVSKHMAENYQVALAFMKDEAAKGEFVLSVPEDTSLYFLSATHCPARVFAFTPGMVVPGKMTDELIQEIERAPVRYLIWSNRQFVEYGVPVFGADYDKTLGDYLRSRYRPLRPLLENGPGWNAVIWERKSDGDLK